MTTNRSVVYRKGTCNMKRIFMEKLGTSDYSKKNFKGMKRVEGKKKEKEEEGERERGRKRKR